MRHFTLQLSSSTPKRLSDVYGAGYTPGAVLDISYSRVELQADMANTGLIYVGGTNATLTTADCGQALPPPESATKPAPPWIRESDGGIRLSEIFVLAANNNEKVHLLLEDLR